MKQNKFWLKLIGIVILLHVTLIVLSILEVVIYSYLINPGHNEEFYSVHATQSAPWISIIFGFLFMFLLVKRYITRFTEQQLTYAIALPLIYSITDFMILIAMNTNLKNSAVIIIIGKAAKFAGSLLAYFIYAKKDKVVITR